MASRGDLCGGLYLELDLGESRHKILLQGDGVSLVKPIRKLIGGVH